MINGLFHSTTVPVLQEVIGFAHARHEVLAGNIANLDTPGYQTRDLSLENFQSQLKEAIAADKYFHSGVSTDMDDLPADSPLREVRESMKTILYHDGSNVGLEQQVAELSKNQFLHNLAISIMHSQFQLLQTAISERV